MRKTQFSQVSEIKRVNNIVADHEIHAFPTIKVPLSRQFMLRRQLLEATAAGVGNQQFHEQGTSNGAIMNLGFDGANTGRILSGSGAIFQHGNNTVSFLKLRV